ncbi:hypothetical protein I9F77_002741 [Salmonella enterica]|nr:hypothetical protein [Salmonella enterica]
MAKLTELEQWDEDVYQIETSDPVVGGPEGISNRPQKQLANRTQWLKKRLEETNNALTEHEKSRNHPDATLTDKGFVKLYSGVTSMDETMAATPRAVKIAMDNANERLAKARNLADLPNVPLALQNLTLAATKKAIEDTQTGLSAQPVMRINSADDLSNLPAGARRFAINNTGVTVLPSADYCYIEVLAKRDTANGSCIKVVECSNPGNAWTGTRNNVPADAAFTWVRQYNESYRPPQQAMPDMPDALIRGNNLSDLTDPPKAVQNLGLKETLNPTKRVSIGNIGTGAFDGSTPCINIGDSDSGFIGSADGVLDIYCNNAKVGYIDNAGLHMLADILSTGAIHAGNATIATDGNINGLVWGGWLNDFLNNNFNRKNTASLQDWGWVRDESTGFIMQWGTIGSSNGTYNFPRAFPVGCLAIFVTNTTPQGGAVDNAFGYPVSNSQFFAATKASTAGNIVNGYPVTWFSIGR